MYNIRLINESSIEINPSKDPKEQQRRVINRNKLETDDHGSCGASVSYAFNTSTGELTISGSGLMNDYSNFNSVPWRSYASSIKTAIVCDGVTSVGQGTFWGCTQLSSIAIPSSVTKIGAQSFRECTNLASVSIPDGVTTIENGVF